MLKIMIGDKPETTNKDMPTKEGGDFPIDNTWKEEATKHLKMAYDLCSKGDGQDAMEISDMIQQVMDALKEEDTSEDESMVEGMEKAKAKSNNYMDNLQSDIQE